MRDKELFYIGYQPHAPRALGRRARIAAAALLLVAVSVAATLALAHSRLTPAVFEFGETRRLEGVVVERPYPTLVVERPGMAGDHEAFSRYLLVGPGKHGAGELVAGYDAKRVRLSGTLVYRDGRTMIEVEPGSIEPVEAATAAPMLATESLGRFTLTGEIVDSKCYLGVMNPGEGKPHRDCAVRCISGGAPPLFVARDAGGRRAQLLLVGPSGEPLNHEVLDFVAEPVEVTGDVIRAGDALVLHANVRTIRRLS